MNIGIRENIDKYAADFYCVNYDLLRTPDFDDSTRFLVSGHGLKYLGNKHNRICRFCDKKENEVSFKKIAYAFPESIGNKSLATYYECDTCNTHFGNYIENDYNKFFLLYHSIMTISGKDGKKKCCFKISCDKRQDNCAKSCVQIAFNGTQPTITKCIEVGNEYIDFRNNSIEISRPIANYCPIAVFKTLVKMALTVMPIEEIKLFSNAIKWILEPTHKNFYNNKPLLIRYKFIPGFNVTKFPTYVLYRRKFYVWDKPYMLFNLTYGCFSLLIEVPRNGESRDKINNRQVENIPFPPIPFYTSADGIWNMSESHPTQYTRNSLILNFESMQEIPTNKIIMQNNKPSIIKL